MLTYPGQTFTVLHDSDDLGLDRGMRGTVEHVRSNGTIDLFVPALDATLAHLSPDHPDIAPRMSWSTAEALLQLWEMPWSTRRLRYATWALARSLRHGGDVLENPRVLESMRMATAESVKSV